MTYEKIEAQGPAKDADGKVSDFAHAVWLNRLYAAQQRVLKKWRRHG